MSPVQCAGCGLAVKEEIGGRRCYGLRRSISEKEMSQYWLCHYYLPIITEDGQPLTPFEHFLLKQDEIDRKK